ncbi:MAG TPA: hypothetical protein VI485_03035 [Vicinamibacterales bacterium]|nr:hypothetical protein [Vicinamibacterales bacterium]
MYRITRIGFVVFAALAFVVPLAFAQTPIAMGKNESVELTRETRVGTAVLKPGHYRFHYEAVDGQHYLVVRSQTTHGGPTLGAHHAGKTGDEIARVPCRLVASDAKQRGTSVYLTDNADGTSTLTRISIRGERGGHVLVPEPQS